MIDGDTSQDMGKCEPASGTHQLESPDRETNQDTERMQASEGHSHPAEPKQRDKSEHKKNVSQRGALTFWRAHMERQVKTQKECKPARPTYFLESPDRETSQDTERMQTGKGHLRSGEPRWRDKSGHRNHVNQQGEPTFWRAQTERQVRTWKECELVRGTHKLGSPDGETSQYMERM